MTRLIFFTSLLFAGTASAISSLDATYGTSGMVFLGKTPVSNLSITPISAVGAQADGKLLIAGQMVTSVNHQLAAVGRLNADGSWDTGFADHGVFVLPYGSDASPYGALLKNVDVLGDGSIVASGGTFTSNEFSYRSCTLILKLTQAGALDANFGPSPSTGSFCFDFNPQPPNYSRNGHFDGLAVDSNSDFYITSVSTNVDHGQIAKFGADGALKTGYGSNGIASLPAQVFTSIPSLDADGRVVVSGILYTTATGEQHIAAARLTTTGTLDDTFGNHGLFVLTDNNPTFAQPTSAGLDDSGRLIFAFNDSYRSPPVPYQFVRTADGVLDSTFNPTGQQPGYPGFAAPVVSGDPVEDVVESINLLPDGRIFAVGVAGTPGASVPREFLALARFQENAAYDASFGDDDHPGWSSINLGGVHSQNYVFASTQDGNGHVFITAGVQGDVNENNCSVVLRAIPDRLFDASLEEPVALASCPQ